MRGALLALGLSALAAIPAFAQETILRIPTPGTIDGMVTRVCRPPNVARAPLVVIAHGSPANPAQRAGAQPWRCTSEAARFFLARGYVVAFPLRRGYGETGGAWAEEFGSCGDADFVRGGRGTAADLATAIEHMHREPYVRPGRTLVIGHSAGGFGAMALAANVPSGVLGLVNVAGGRGGRPGSAATESTCSPERLVSAASTFGGGARVPMLWIYARNDSFFSPGLAARLHAAYTAAGGRARLVMAPPFGADGHRLFAGGGSGVWGPEVDRFMRGGR